MSANLPFVKIKRIIKFDPDVHMVNTEATVAMSLACEMFIKAFANEIYVNANFQTNKRTIHLKDVDDLILKAPWLEFLDGALDTWTDAPSRRTKAKGRGGDAVAAEAAADEQVEEVDDEEVAGDDVEEAEQAEEQVVDDEERVETPVVEVFIGNNIAVDGGDGVLSPPSSPISERGTLIDDHEPLNSDDNSSDSESETERGGSPAVRFISETVPEEMPVDDVITPDDACINADVLENARKKAKLGEDDIEGTETD